MGKNTPGPGWWWFTGGDKGIRSITNALNHNRHFMVLDTKKQIYLRIQGSETRFVEGLADSHNCRATKVLPPVYTDTLCGKRSTPQSINAHQRRCNACGRVRKNEQSASTQVATVEEAPEVAMPGVISSTDPRSGPVITVQGPSEHRSDDYAGLAADNRRTADELMGKAEYYMQVADYYDAMLKPTDAVTEAEALLKKAQDDEQADRDRQKAELDALIANGPPA